MKLFEVVRPQPDSIRWFERLEVIGIVIDCIYYLTTDLPYDAERFGWPLSLAGIAIITIVSLTLTLLASRRASRIALWIILTLTALSIALALWNFGNGLINDWVGLFGLVSVVCYLAAARFAFAPASRAWFRGDAAQLAL